jgi:CO/xanthine dehydrogenase Mo-binding subunit
VPLKDPEDFHLIGTSVGRVDESDYIRGKAVFGIDHVEDGMLFAAVSRCPVVGGRVKSMDAKEAERFPGVREIIEVEGAGDPFYMAAGVAVIADDTWSALEGRRLLKIEWDFGENGDASTEALRKELAEKAAMPGEVLRDDGDTEGAFASSEETIEARYELPFLAHATMEPMNCTARVGGGSCDIWSPTQNPQSVQRAVSGMLGLPEDKVNVHVTLLGGGFGRRLYPDTEIEAVKIARRMDAPVKVVWTREDDLRWDRYRPASLHVLRGAIDDKGMPTAWRWHILNTYTGRFVEDDFPAFAIKNYHVEYTHVPFVLPRGAWRGTVNSQNPFVVHSFLDELAAAGNRDPMDLRLKLVRGADRPEGGEDRYGSRRMTRVIETAAEMSGWGGKLPQGVGRGTAFFFGYESYCAQVAEVEVRNGRPRVRRVVCVVDCGEVVNPDLVEAQCEGGIAFALSAALKQKISVSNGRVVEGNFDDYPMIEIGEMPEVESHIIASREAPGGMGEVPLPPLFAAVTNAIYDATGVRVRKLPVGTVRKG